MGALRTLARNIKTRTRPRSIFRPRVVIGVLFVFVVLLTLYQYKTESFSAVSAVKDSVEAEQTVHEQIENEWLEYVEAASAVSLYKRANGTFFMLARDQELEEVLLSMAGIEERFNHRFNYPWVFANEQEFSKEFIQRTSELASGSTEYELIPKEMWDYPSWIDQDLAQEVRDQMEIDGVKYGDSESYRHMCRFNSGFFYHLPKLQQYRYYWRVEPDVQYNCDINYDLIKHMEDNNKTYGFAMAPFEIHTTVLSIWSVVTNFTAVYPNYLVPNNSFEFLTDDNGATYNMCHFWSNFEIADMDFFRSQTYEDFFHYLDLSGGFYYERWGDAPVHSIAVALFLDRSQLHYVADTGYFHSPNGQCPRDLKVFQELQCTCIPDMDYNWGSESCIPLYFELNGIPRPESVKKKSGLKSHLGRDFMNSNPIVKDGFRVVNN